MAEKEMADFADREELGAAHATRPGTDTNIYIQLLVGLVGTGIVWLLVQPLQATKFSYLYGIICERGPVQYVELVMAFMVGTFIFMKSRIIRAQLRIIAEGPLDPNLDLEDDEQIQDMRNAAFERDAFSWSIVLNRLDRMLALWLGSKDVGRVAAWSATESERDSSASDSTYATVRVLIWAIPILGFIGTVMGLGAAVSGFADFLAEAAELSQIKEAIGSVTLGLGVAFDTTLLALILSVFLMFPLAAVQRREENFFVELDNYLDDTVTSRLPSAEQQPVVIENLEDAIEAAFRRYIPDPDRYDEVFTRSIDKAAGVVEERFATLAHSYESTLHDLTGRLTASVASAGDSLQGSLQKVVDDIQAQEAKMLESRADIGKQELANFKSLMDELYGSASSVAESYKQTASAMQQATQESAEQSVAAAKTLTQRMEEVGRLAEGIKDLLRIEQALQQSLETISASEEFQKTLADLREHLATTDAFCSRMTKPRVITLREEIAS